MRQPPPNPKAAQARADIEAYNAPLLVNPPHPTEQIIVTFTGAGYPDITGPTWDAAEIEAWYSVAKRNTDAALVMLPMWAE